MIFRKTLFWTHLIAGICAGMVIAIMCLTGAAMAFETDIVSWAERDARIVVPPAKSEPRIPIREFLRSLRESEPDARSTAITVFSDPRRAVSIGLGRDDTLYANPYTGALHRPASTKVHAALQAMEDWHRTLALGGDRRPIGKLINGSANIAFCILAVTGLYLWWPRSWSWRSVRAIAWFESSTKGKARDFNWHNVVGLWSAPVLIVLTLTAIPMSFRWGSNLISRLAGETPSGSAVTTPTASAPAINLPAPGANSRRLDYDALFAVAQKEFPDWEQLSMRLGGGPRSANAASDDSRRETQAARPRENRSEGRPGAQAVSIDVRRPGQWPRTATTTLTLNPYTGEILKQEGYADLAGSRKVRAWTRFLHTGQALGLPGQAAAALACVGGCVLVYTGFAMAIRRLFAWRKKSARV